MFHLKKIKNSISRSVFVFSVLLFLAFAPSPTSAYNEGDLSGFAWSSNIGWISFSCLDQDANCGKPGNTSAAYGVSKDASGNLSGFAWSSNIGWIKFGGLSSFPGVGTNAKITGTTLTGWARACAGTASGDCSSMTSRTDGWDGWISLDGSGYGITLANNIFSGYAWGSSVVGWIDFNVKARFPNCPTCGVIIGEPTAVTSVDLQAVVVVVPQTNDTIEIDASTNFGLKWTLTGLPTDSLCTVKKESGTGTGGLHLSLPLSNVIVNGQTSTGPLSAGNYVFKLECKKDTSVWSDAVTVTVGTAPTTFTLGGDNTITIKVLKGSPIISETRIIDTQSEGGFVGDVEITKLSVVDVSDNPYTTNPVSYAINGSSFNSASVVGQDISPSPIGSPKTIAIKLDTLIPNACGISTSGCDQYYVKIDAISGSTVGTVKYRIIQIVASPRFEEF